VSTTSDTISDGQEPTEEDTVSSATRQYQIATNAEIGNILEGRLRQLELEHAGHALRQQEENADPHTVDAQKKQTGRDIESLEARIDTVKRALENHPKTEKSAE
jgi:hypothetical protein